MKNQHDSDARKARLGNLNNKKQQLIVLIGELHSAMDYTKRLLDAINSYDQLTSTTFDKSIVMDGYPLLKKESLLKRIAEQKSRNKELEAELASVNDVLIKLGKTKNSIP